MNLHLHMSSEKNESISALRHVGISAMRRLLLSCLIICLMEEENCTELFGPRFRLVACER